MPIHLAGYANSDANCGVDETQHRLQRSIPWADRRDEHDHGSCCSVVMMSSRRPSNIIIIVPMPISAVGPLA
jgi:hypothetical protein